MKIFADKRPNYSWSLLPVDNVGYIVVVQECQDWRTLVIMR